MSRDFPYINREISWLSFNERVLQEAEDERNPLIERLRFLGIFSNNLDEFFRVRVATVKRMMQLNKKTRALLDFDPHEIMHEITRKTLLLQNRFEFTYQKLIKQLEKHNVFIINEQQLNDPELKNAVEQFFVEQVRPYLITIMLNEKKSFPVLKDKSIYLAVKLSSQNKHPLYSIIEIPTDNVSRFFTIKSGEKTFIVLLDDVIRSQFDKIFFYFHYEKIEAYTIKLTRDAELDINENVAVSLVDKLKKSLKNRKTATPVRFVYDKTMPEDLLKFILKKLKITDVENIIPGGRYHNFKDFMKFPDVGHEELLNPPLPPLEHKMIDHSKNLIDQIKKNDIMLFYPFQKFYYLIEFLRQSAIDPNVTEIKINLYRVAKNSRIINALINAVKNGKKVTAVVELWARFDEANNIYWANKLQDEGVKVIFGIPGLKVHSKLILIKRKENKKTALYAHIGTGNFNEVTAKVYTDISFITAKKQITNEVAKVFEFFENNFKTFRYSHLLVSPFNTRRKFIQLIDNEIKLAKQGKKAYIILKMNNLEDDEIIKKLYQANQSGVKINMIIRGICCLVPGVKKYSENIKAISIVDRFLEHSRVMIFGNGGDEKIYISSADWMHRNFDKRVEVSVPIEDVKLKKLIKKVIEIQLKDNQKARIIDELQTNPYVKPKNGESPVRSQTETYNYFKNSLK
jgi:polyphosphate kinase